MRYSTSTIHILHFPQKKTLPKRVIFFAEQACKPGSVLLAKQQPSISTASCLTAPATIPKGRTGHPQSLLFGLLRVVYRQPVTCCWCALPHRFILLPEGTVCFLWHFLRSPHWTLSSTLPYGARTFLSLKLRLPSLLSFLQ